MSLRQQIYMISIPILIEKVERNYLHILISQLEGGKTTVEETQRKTKIFLALQPFTSLADMKIKLKQYVKQYTEFNEIYITFLKLEEQENIAKILNKINEFT